MKAKQCRVSWVWPTILSVMLTMTAADDAYARPGDDRHKRIGPRLLHDIAVTAGVEAAMEWLRTVVQAKPEPDTHAAAQYFEIPEGEYRRWPEGRRRLVEAVYATSEQFLKRTIALMKTLDAEDWELMERTASYVIIPTMLLPKDRRRGTGSFDELEPHERVELHAMGILGSAGASGVIIRFKAQSEEKLVITKRFGDHALVMRFKDVDQTVEWPAIPITKVGQELLVLLQKAPNLVTPEWNYIRALGEGIAAEGVAADLWKVSDVRDPKMLMFERMIWAIAATK